MTLEISKLVNPLPEFSKTDIITESYFLSGQVRMRKHWSTTRGRCPCMKVLTSPLILLCPVDFLENVFARWESLKRP